MNSVAISSRPWTFLCHLKNRLIFTSKCVIVFLILTCYFMIIFARPYPIYLFHFIPIMARRSWKFYTLRRLQFFSLIARWTRATKLLCFINCSLCLSDCDPRQFIWLDFRLRIIVFVCSLYFKLGFGIFVCHLVLP